MDVFDDNATLCMSNNSRLAKNAIVFAANQGKMSFADTHAIADTGATLVFVMKGIPMQNVKRLSCPSQLISQMVRKYNQCTHERFLDCQ